MKINKGRPFWGFNHKEVLDKLNGTKFCNEFCIKDNQEKWSQFPLAVYYRNNPKDKETDYFYLWRQKEDTLISGMSKESMEEFRYQEGIHCVHCNDIIYSKYNQDNMNCSCDKCGIKGGREQTDITGESGDYKMVIVDLLNDTFELMRKKL